MRKVAVIAGLLMAVGATGTVQAQTQPRNRVISSDRFRS